MNDAIIVAWFRAGGVDVDRVLDYIDDPDSYHGPITDEEAK